MTSRISRMGSRGSRSRKACRAVRVVGLGVIAGAFLAVGMVPVATAPQAHADLEDIFQPVIDAISQAVNVADPGLATSFDPALTLAPLQSPPRRLPPWRTQPCR